MADPRELVRTIVEGCWSDPAGLDRLRALVADGYVHHTPLGDWTYHCRIENGLVAEEWDVFFPMG